MDKKLELQIIGVAEDDCGPVAGVDDSGVTDALFVEVRYPLLQFVFVRDPERQMVQPHALLIESVRRRSSIVTHNCHADPRWMSHGHALKGVLTNLVHQYEA